MKLLHRTAEFAAFVLAAFFLAPFAMAQDKEWQRVITGQDSNIDVNTTSLVLEANYVLSAKFRTTLAKSEPVPGMPNVKYKTRIETIQFNYERNGYRPHEASYVDSSGKVVATWKRPPEATWKPATGGTADRLYSAASALRPLGTWTVRSVRFADGLVASPVEDPEVTRLLGDWVLTKVDQFKVGNDNCRSPSYEARAIGDQEFQKWLGRPMSAMGLVVEKLDAVLIRCTAGSMTELHLLLLLPDERATLLSGGVLLDLDRPKN